MRKKITPSKASRAPVGNSPPPRIRRLSLSDSGFFLLVLSLSVNKWKTSVTRWTCQMIQSMVPHPSPLITWTKLSSTAAPNQSNTVNQKRWILPSESKHNLSFIHAWYVYKTQHWRNACLIWAQYEPNIKNQLPNQIALQSIDSGGNKHLLREGFPLFGDPKFFCFSPSKKWSMQHAFRNVQFITSWKSYSHDEISSRSDQATVGCITSSRKFA